MLKRKTKCHPANAHAQVLPAHSSEHAASNCAHTAASVPPAIALTQQRACLQQTLSHSSKQTLHTITPDNHAEMQSERRARQPLYNTTCRHLQNTPKPKASLARQPPLHNAEINSESTIRYTASRRS